MLTALSVCFVVIAYHGVYGTILVYSEDAKNPMVVEEFRDMPASFGGDVPADGLSAYLALAEPPDACVALAPPPANLTGKWAVLIARYNCNFETKVRNAQAAGYDCAIVHNVNSSDLETMSAKNPDGITIPSVFVSELAGLLLGGEYLYNNGYFIMVNGDLPFNINTHLLLPFAIVVALCLLIMLIFMIVKCIKDRRRARRHRLPGRALRKIPTCKFSKGDPYDTCAICLDDYQEGERLRVLPCAHAYHAKCIDPWLTQNRRVCPVCKRRVLAAGERRRRHSASDSDSDSSREPLVSDAPATQGGTFEEQRENPFARANRFMRALRRGTRLPPAPPPEAPPEENDETEQAEEDNIQQNDDDTQPLIVPRVTSEAERPRSARRSRRSRRASSTPPGAAGTSPATGDTSPGTAGDSLPAGSTPPALPPPDHSINARGEIGVAALPANNNNNNNDRHINL